MRALQLRFVELQSLLLGAFSGVGHVAFMRFLHTIHIAGTSSTDKHFSEEATAFFILQSVDGEDFLAIHIGQTKDRFDGIKAFFELALVK